MAPASSATRTVLGAPSAVRASVSPVSGATSSRAAVHSARCRQPSDIGTCLRSTSPRSSICRARLVAMIRSNATSSTSIESVVRDSRVMPTSTWCLPWLPPHVSTVAATVGFSLRRRLLVGDGGRQGRLSSGEVRHILSNVCSIVKTGSTFVETDRLSISPGQRSARASAAGRRGCPSCPAVQPGPARRRRSRTG